MPGVHRVPHDLFGGCDHRVGVMCRLVGAQGEADRRLEGGHQLVGRCELDHPVVATRRIHQVPDGQVSHPAVQRLAHHPFGAGRPNAAK